MRLSGLRSVAVGCSAFVRWWMHAGAVMAPRCTKPGHATPEPAQEFPPSSHSGEHGHEPEVTGAGSPCRKFDAAQVYHGDWYTLGQFGRLRVTIGYYIDSLTVVMFAMVTLIASCIHFYAIGYMHDELHDVIDHEVTLSDGHICIARAASIGSSNICRCFASACWASSSRATS